MLVRHRRLDNGLLHRPPVVAGRLRPECLKTEPALELLPGVMAFPAPLAGRIGAGLAPEQADDPSRFRELVAHPGRHDGVAARHPVAGRGPTCWR